MKRKVLVIGIGAGNPEHMTVQGIEALNRADVLFIPDKGAEKEGLAAVRREICRRFIRQPGWREVGYEIPARDRTPQDYEAAVDAWHEALAGIFERLLMEDLGEGQTGAFLVWGDPALYDSTLRILARVSKRGRVEPELEVVPGISSVQALTAAHRIALNDIGRPVTITTGRRLAEAPDGASVVVMLDGEHAYRRVDPDTEIFWGAYVGMPDEILVAGKAGDVAGEIDTKREAARAEKGWIMDVYLLRPKT